MLSASRRQNLISPATLDIYIYIYMSGARLVIRNVGDKLPNKLSRTGESGPFFPNRSPVHAGKVSKLEGLVHGIENL